MNHRVKFIQKPEKGVEQLFFGISPVCKPLSQMPGTVPKLGTANQIKVGIVAGKSGGINVEK